MEIGTRLVSNAGQDAVVKDIACEGRTGAKLYKVWSMWYTREKLLEQFSVLLPALTPEIGDILISKHTRNRYEVIAKDGDRLNMFNVDRPVFGYTKKPNVGWRTPEEWSGNYHLPTRHRFFVEDDELKVDPPLELVDGVHHPLELSIRKWEVLAEYDGYVCNSSEHCALCELYNPVYRDVLGMNCNGCPVKAKTGKDQCSSTPYWDYYDPESAQRMVEFLKSLRTTDKHFRKEKYPVGTLLQGDINKHYYRVDGMRTAEAYNLFDLTEDKRATGHDTEQALDNLWTVVSHAFYVRDGILCVTPLLTGNEPDPLGLSIKKWEAIVEAVERRVQVESDGGADTCGLCMSYRSCHKCPANPCGTTPYCWWERSKSLAAAQAELAFLEELRDGV